MPAPYDLYDYVAYWKNRSYEDNSERIALERLLKLIPKGDKVIDIGGGFGRLCTVYKDQFQSCFVLDPSDKNLNDGKRLFPGLKNVSFIKGSLPRLDFDNNSFDMALMIRVSHHLEEISFSLSEVSRILKKEGFFILEVANKIHFLARIKAVLAGNFSFVKNLNPIEKRSLESINQNKIAFVNHHPKKIILDLKSSGFEILEILSVSNFRIGIIKTIAPIKILLFLEKRVQKVLGKFFFGPSIFILAKKVS